MDPSRGRPKASAKSAGIEPQSTPHQLRRERRSGVSVSVTVLGVTEGGGLFLELASTRDVSLHGCRIRLRTKAHSEMPFHLRLVPREGPIPDDARPLPYTIVWMHETEDYWEIGALALGDFDLLQLAFPSRTP
jgi:hypothetical protein